MAKKITDLTALTVPDSDDVIPIVDTSASETKKITVSNLFLGRIYTVKSTSDSIVNPDPQTPTLVDSMTITLPSLPQTTTAIVMFDIAKIGTHPSRYLVYVDDASITVPTNSNIWYDIATGENNGRHMAFITTISLSSGSHHVEIREEAALATDSVTFKDRTLVIILL